jgi:hypothetical protein
MLYDGTDDGEKGENRILDSFPSFSPTGLGHFQFFFLRSTTGALLDSLTTPSDNVPFQTAAVTLSNSTGLNSSFHHIPFASFPCRLWDSRVTDTSPAEHPYQRYQIQFYNIPVSQPCLQRLNLVQRSSWG